MASIDSNKATTATITATSSHLLIWPRRRRRPRDDVGFVLGWKNNITIDSSTGIQREIIICAGILPPTESLPTYRRRLAKLRDHVSEQKPKLCSCLVRSLDIVAIWTSSPNTKVPEESESPPMRIITQQRRRFPWWKDDDVAGIHRQLIFYDPPGTDPKDIYSHFHSDYDVQSSSNEWSMLLHKLNHAQEIVACVQNGIFPFLAKDPSSFRATEESGMQDKSIRNASNGLFSQWKAFAFRSSMTLLHFQQIYDRQQQPGILPWLSFLSISRCLLYSPTRPNSEQRPALCRHCGEALPFVSRSKGARNYVSKWNRYLEATLDFSLGAGAALLLFMAWRYSNPHGNLWYYYTNARKWSMNGLTDAVLQLERFPAGFKLNVSLTDNMGQGIRHIISLQRMWLESTLWSVEYGQTLFLPLLFSIAGTCGWSSLLAILIDLWRLETLHVWLLTTLFRYMYLMELFLLSALFRLFRGKKRNVLRQRTDSMQYDAMQLLVGTIGFCVCIFLWTTMMVYYTSFVIFNWIFNLPVIFLWIAYMASRAIPWGTLSWRLWRPQWFVQTVHLESMSADDQNLRVALLCSVAASPLSVFVSGVSVHIRGIGGWILNCLLEVLIPRMSNQAPSSIPLSTLMENFCVEDS